MFREVKVTNDAMKTAMEKARADRLRVNVTMQLLGLFHVRDTYVGDQTVRGISGGQRRRVTVGMCDETRSVSDTVELSNNTVLALFTQEK